MIYISPCGECKHLKKSKIDGWKPLCDAFPEGFPKGFPNKDVTALKECNNGIGYEPVEEE